MGGVDTKDNEDQSEGSEKSESEEDDVNDMDFVPARHKPEIDGDDDLEGEVIREKDTLVDDLSEALERQMLNEARKERAASSTRKTSRLLALEQKQRQDKIEQEQLLLERAAKLAEKKRINNERRIARELKQKELQKEMREKYAAEAKVLKEAPFSKFVGKKTMNKATKVKLKATLDDVFSKHDEAHGQMSEEEQLKYNNWKKGLKSAESRKNAEENEKLSTEMIVLKLDNKTSQFMAKYDWGLW